MKLLFAFVCLLCVISACNVGSSASPKETLTKFLTAMEHGDFKEAKKYATSDSQSFLDMIDKSDEAADGYKDKELIVTDKSVIHDDGADVEVEDKLDAQMIHYHLQKEGGVWKVSFNLNALERTAIDTAIDAVKKTGKDVQKDINEALDSIKIDLDSSK